MRPFASRWVHEWLLDAPDRRHRRLDEAALVFLDISGFTAMSEMLAKLGRVGAEEVREVVNQTFTELLDLAYEEGASLLKFGGDALLLLLDGERAGDAAIRAAWAMRRQLHGANPVTTAAGSLDLDVTIGVHVGPVDLFLVGSSHRELIVAGPAGTAVIETEGAAEKGQILLSSAVLVPDGVEVRSRPDGLQELLACAIPETSEVRDPPPGAPPLIDTAPVLSPLITERLAELPTGEHRQATIAFVHFSGTDSILANQGADALATALQDLTTTIQHACEVTDVCLLSTDIDANGGKFILTAGVPVAADDDDDRMVNACRRIIEAGPALPVQIGVNRGPVFTGVVGPAYRLTYTVLGDAVNLAARIMNRADHGELLAEAGVMNSCRTLFDVTPIEPFQVKGKQAPVRAVRVGSELGVRVRIRSDDTPFVGHESELDELIRTLDQITTVGAGQAIGLTGPAGIGKSRLIDELQERRAGVPIHLIGCSRFGAERPYRAAGMLLRLVLTGERHGDPRAVIAEAQRLALHHDGLSPWLPLLGDLYDVDLPDTPDTAGLAAQFRGPQTRRIIALLLASALWGNAVIIIEDLHWLDPESREVLVELTRYVLPDRPWLVVGTTREPDHLVEGMRQVPVANLDADAVNDLLLGAVDRGELPIDQLSAVAERGAGNPLFLIELVRNVSQGDFPDSLESLFQKRLDDLPAAHRRLLSHAAVLGLEFPPDLLLAVSETSTDVNADDLNLLGDFVTQMRSGYWRFTQSLIQEVAYLALPYRTRRRLHGRAAQALEDIQSRGGQITIEALSRHHHLSGQYERSWKSSRQAFAVARGRSAVESAARFARRSIEAGQRIKAPDRAMARMWEGLADVLELSGAYADAEDAYRRARRYAGSGSEARLCRQIGHIKERKGEYTQALRWYAKSQRAAEADGDPSGAAQTALRRAVTLVRQGRRAQATALADLVLARNEDLGDLDRAHAMWIRGWVMSETRASGTADVLRESGRLFRAAGGAMMESKVVNALGANAYHEGDWVAAAQLYRESRDICRRIGDRGNEAVCDANLGEVLGDQGHFEEALAALRGAYNFARATRHEYLRTGSLLYLGRVCARIGSFDDADRYLAEAGSEAAELGLRAMLGEILLRRAELELFRGHWDAMDRELEEFKKTTERGVPVPLEVLHLRLRGCRLFHAGQDGGPDLIASRDQAAAAGLRFDELMARAAMQEHAVASGGPSLHQSAHELGIVCSLDQLIHGVRLAQPGA